MKESQKSSVFFEENKIGDIGIISYVEVAAVVAGIFMTRLAPRVFRIESEDTALKLSELLGKHETGAPVLRRTVIY